MFRRGADLTKEEPRARGGHGGDIYGADGLPEKLLDFSVNVDPRGPAPAVRRFLENGDLAALAARYPDPESRALKKAIIVYERAFSGAELAAERLLVGAGASAVIQAIALSRAFLRVFLCVPLFGGYRRAFAAAGAQIVSALPEAGFPVSALPEDICGQVRRASPDLVVLCNPANPTGLVAESARLAALESCCEAVGATLLVDECFLEFLPDGGVRTLAGEAAKGRRVIVLRALTKRFALPGLRVGYGWFGDGELAGRVGECLPEWGVSGIAQEAGRIALAEALDGGMRLETVHDTERERNYLTGELCRRGCRVIPGEANYLCFSGPAGLKEALLQKDVLIRDCGDYEGLPNGLYRIAVRTREDALLLLDAFDSVYSHRKP